MADITIRNVDEKTVEALNEQAKEAGISREALIRQALDKVANGDYIPATWGQGFEAYTKDGGRVRLINLSESVQSNATKLTSEEMSAFNRAKLLASPKNGSRWQDARKALEEAGFEVFNV